MATQDVPGFNPANLDQLRMGCWAEHKDGSLILVESTEGDRVIYSLFDLSKEPPLEYRDAMPEAGFKKAFSWKSGEAVGGLEWTWHDKTPFDWDRIIKDGAKPGPRYVVADDQITAAQRVADALRLTAETLDVERRGKVPKKVLKLANKLQKALDALPA